MNKNKIKNEYVSFQGKRKRSTDECSVRLYLIFSRISDYQDLFSEIVPLRVSIRN